VAELLEPFADAKHARAAAHRLIAHFGSLGRALSASQEKLTAVLGGDEAIAHAIVAARNLVAAGLRDQVSRSRVSAREPAFLDYLHLRIGRAPTECLHATFVNHDWGYLSDDVLVEGMVGSVESDLRTLLSRAFDIGAHGVLLAHNHPSGSAEPSQADIDITRRIALLTQTVGIRLVDHLIVGAREITSMRERGLI